MTETEWELVRGYHQSKPPPILGFEYAHGFKALQINLKSPVRIREWWWFLWGVDIFLGEVPVIKTMIGLNLLVWGLLLTAK